MGRNAAAGFHWGIFSGEDAPELHHVLWEVLPLRQAGKMALMEVREVFGSVAGTARRVCVCGQRPRRKSHGHRGHAQSQVSYSWVATTLCLGSTAVRSQNRFPKFPLLYHFIGLSGPRASAPDCLWVSSVPRGQSCCPQEREWWGRGGRWNPASEAGLLIRAVRHRIISNSLNGF